MRDATVHRFRMARERCAQALFSGRFPLHSCQKPSIITSACQPVKNEPNTSKAGVCPTDLEVQLSLFYHGKWRDRRFANLHLEQ